MLFQKYNLERPVQKSYLHTNRAICMPGEIIWFKGCLFNGNTHMADYVDRAVHIELVSVSGCGRSYALWSAMHRSDRHRLANGAGGLRNRAV